MQPLSLNIRVMKKIVLWPETTITTNFVIKHILLLFSLHLNPFFVAVGAFRQLNHLEDIVILLDHIIGLESLLATVYMSECFIYNVKNIKKLSEEISAFSTDFRAKVVIEETEKKIQKYTKAILLYGVIGNILYALFPLLTKKNCEATRIASELTRQRDPCGLVLRVWYFFDISQFPLFYIVFLLETYTCVAVSIIVLAITMVLVGLLMFAVALFKDCGEKIKHSCNDPDDENKRKNVDFCVRYHIAIINYSGNINKAFSSMMLMHITLTSFEISVLGFEILMMTNPLDSFRFGVHLIGWLILLFLICFYGQKLIDESTEIGSNVYSTEWYNSPVSVRKDLKLMILRSQRPLALTAAALGIMSLETFLGVMSTAYSYFTILLNMKDN